MGRFFSVLCTYRKIFLWNFLRNFLKYQSSGSLFSAHDRCHPCQAIMVLSYFKKTNFSCSVCFKIKYSYSRHPFLSLLSARKINLFWNYKTFYWPSLLDRVKIHFITLIFNLCHTNFNLNNGFSWRSGHRIFIAIESAVRWRNTESCPHINYR